MLYPAPVRKRPADSVTLPPLTYVNSPNQSERTEPVRMVVLHDTEGSYSGAVSWFSQRKSEVSAHLVLSEDGHYATQMVPYHRKAWHCAAFNSCSIGLEMAGFAKAGYGSSELKHAARIVAFLLHAYGLPPKLLTGKALLSGRGFALHQDLGAAGGGHHDPGFSWLKKQWFASLVAAELKRGGFRNLYGYTDSPAV